MGERCFSFRFFCPQETRQTALAMTTLRDRMEAQIREGSSGKNRSAHVRHTVSDTGDSRAQTQHQTLEDARCQTSLKRTRGKR